MGTIADKLTYLNNAIDDIQAAINEKGITVSNDIPLENYGAKIRSIETGNSSGAGNSSGIAVLDMFGGRNYSVISTPTPTKHTYTSL